jgi:PERQ amino acid-rich with GYF domain-containing protein
MNGNGPLSYSRITNNPILPSFPPENGYYTGQTDGVEGGGKPFQYTPEQIFALYDEEKVRERPIELVDLAENGGALVSKSVVRPVGMRDLTEIEKKVSFSWLKGECQLTV